MTPAISIEDSHRLSNEINPHRCFLIPTYIGINIHSPFPHLSLSKYIKLHRDRKSIDVINVPCSALYPSAVSLSFNVIATVINASSFSKCSPPIATNTSPVSFISQCPLPIHSPYIRPAPWRQSTSTRH
ncbi:hypothetical protein M431DRAFT_211572 [Trichoderma harzianum CBS 226.95]|uniref:Uncharacterized protein n=1 Tax=Trichoderma harzianum CBS 226.95 TaxID=983964 RepID=A0A2T4A4X3_TRIHA|nr:hypothetical protein M431DRAFT_211572 [Trichoderma harzianum CBS 226.95]PTB52115.1 hypothetical protein M431DRAFT_211572 [Trichoderma harzianum CBS 226.95]